MSTDANVEHVRDLLATIPDLRFRRMFGGVGVYSGACMFALLADDQLYIKTDAENRGAFEAAGSVPFAFEAQGRTTPTSYWRLPAAAEDDPAEAERWARLGLEAAGRKPTPKRRKGAAPVDLGPGPWDG